MNKEFLRAIIQLSILVCQYFILILQMMLNVESLDKFQVGIIVFNKLSKDQIQYTEIQIVVLILNCESGFNKVWNY